MPNYGDASYWDHRYQEKNTTFDWLERWQNIKFYISMNTIPGIENKNSEEIS